MPPRKDDSSPRGHGVPFNRDFQKAEVIKYLVRKDLVANIAAPLSISANFFDNDANEGYLVFLYKVKEAREYEEGFGPSVTVLVGNDETYWKRSRNKWNPFERIRTLDGLNNEQGFTIMWDRSKSNSYYVTERMYYYLDKDKHRDKYRNVRAKLYITRLHQTENIFLLQFITERLNDDDMDVSRAKEDKKHVRKTSLERKHGPGLRTAAGGGVHPSTSPLFNSGSHSMDTSSITPMESIPEGTVPLSASRNYSASTFPVLRPKAIKPQLSQLPVQFGFSSPLDVASVQAQQQQQVLAQHQLMQLQLMQQQAQQAQLAAYNFGVSLPPLQLSGLTQAPVAPFLQPTQATPAWAIPGFNVLGPSFVAESAAAQLAKNSVSVPGPKPSFQRNTSHSKSRSMDVEPPSRWRTPIVSGSESFVGNGSAKRHPQPVEELDMSRAAKRRSLDLRTAEIDQLTPHSHTSGTSTPYSTSSFASSPSASPPVGSPLTNPINPLHGFVHAMNFAPLSPSVGPMNEPSTPMNVDTPSTPTAPPTATVPTLSAAIPIPTGANLFLFPPQSAPQLTLSMSPMASTQPHGLFGTGSAGFQ